MRKVVLYQLMSLDGVAEEPGNWMADGSPAIFDNLRSVIATQDTVLLGRGTFDYWVDHWPTSDMEPFASFINDTQKLVFTSSEPTKRWTNTTVVAGPAIDSVTRLKHEDGGDIGIHGSIRLSQSLLAAHLVDELRLVVAPAVAYDGRRLFEGGTDIARWELISSETTPAGTLLLGYRAGPAARD